FGVGLRHVCAVAEDRVYCWGNNAAGQCGNGLSNGLSVTKPAPVVAVDGFRDVVQVAGGYMTSCGLTASGSVYCWGISDLLGVGCSGGEPCGGSGCRPVPSKVSVGDVAEIAMGQATVLARLGGGGLAAWGANAYGQMGNGSTSMTSVLLPVPVANFP